MNFQDIKICEKTDEFCQSVCENFNTNLDQLEKDVQVLRDWLNSQPHLPHCASDTMLKTYLLACKNKMEKAKTKLENYYVARAELPEIFQERDPTHEKIIENGELIHYCTPPKLTPDGCRVTLIAFRPAEVKFDANTYTKRVIMAEDIKMNMDPFINGCYYVFDGKYLTLSHIMKMTPQMLRNLVYCGQNVLPLVIKGLIFINSPTYVEIVMNIVKPFMKSKLFQRIHIHTGGAEVLGKYFPKALLPKDYGGDEEESSEKMNESWMKCLKENRDWFLNEGQLKANISDENKNKVAEKKEEFQELQGSFKTLCID